MHIGNNNICIDKPLQPSHCFTTDGLHSKIFLHIFFPSVESFLAPSYSQHYIFIIALRIFIITFCFPSDLKKKKKNYMLDCQKIRKLGSFPKEEKISTRTKISQRTNLLLLPRNSSFEKKKKNRYWGKCKLSLMSQPIDSNLI